MRSLRGTVLGPYVLARVGCIALGLWLFASSFLGRSTPQQETNAWVVGLFAVVLGALALRAEPARYFNTLLGAWLILSAFLLPSASLATSLHQGAIGALLAVMSLLPSPRHVWNARRAWVEEQARVRRR